MENRRNFLVKLAALFGAYLAPTSLLERGSSQAKSSTVNPIDNLDTSLGEAASGCLGGVFNYETALSSCSLGKEAFIRYGSISMYSKIVRSRYFGHETLPYHFCIWEEKPERTLLRWQFNNQKAFQHKMYELRNMEYDWIMEDENA